MRGKDSCPKCRLCIGSIPLFEHLSAEDQQKILAEAEHEQIPAGRVIFSPDEPADRIVIIRSGKLKLSNYDSNGKEYIYDILTAGDVYGEAAIFSDQRFAVYGETLTAAQLCTLTADTVASLVASDAALGIKMIQALGRKVAEAQSKARILAIDDAGDRVVQYLIMRYKQLRDPEIALKRQAVAAAINLSRETVSRKLSELESAGIIQSIGYKRIRLLNVERLLAMAKE